MPHTSASARGTANALLSLRAHVRSPSSEHRSASLQSAANSSTLRPSAVVAGRGMRQPFGIHDAQVSDRVRVCPRIGRCVVRVCRVATQDAGIAGIRSERGPVELRHPRQVVKWLRPRMLATMHRTGEQVEHLRVSARRACRVDIRGWQIARAHAACRRPFDRLSTVTVKAKRRVGVSRT